MITSTQPWHFISTAGFTHGRRPFPSKWRSQRSADLGPALCRSTLWFVSERPKRCAPPPRRGRGCPAIVITVALARRQAAIAFSRRRDDSSLSSFCSGEAHSTGAALPSRRECSPSAPWKRSRATAGSSRPSSPRRRSSENGRVRAPLALRAGRVQRAIAMIQVRRRRAALEAVDAVEHGQPGAWTTSSATAPRGHMVERQAHEHGPVRPPPTPKSASRPPVAEPLEQGRHPSADRAVAATWDTLSRRMLRPTHEGRNNAHKFGIRVALI